jgi:hypothetical protein
MTSQTTRQTALAETESELERLEDELVSTPAGRVDRYGVALALIIGIIAVEFLGFAGRWAPVVAIALGCITLLFCLTASDAPRPIVLVSRIGVALALGIAIGATLLGDSVVATGAIPLTGAAVAFVTPLPIARRLISQPTIGVHTVLGALCLYLLAGLFFAYVYLAIDEFAGPVFTEIPTATLTDTIYFSFVTLATLGFGDLTPGSNAGRLASITEGIGGQVYLVTIIAMLVGNLGRKRPTVERREDQW